MILSSLLVTPTQALANEDLLYLTDIVDDGGVLESKVEVDSDGNLHTFSIIKNSNGTRLVHLYYIEGEANFDIVENFAQGAHLLYSYVDGTKVGIVYSIDTELGARQFRVHEQQDSFENNILLFQ